MVAVHSIEQPQDKVTKENLYRICSASMITRLYERMRRLRPFVLKGQDYLWQYFNPQLFNEQFTDFPAYQERFNRRVKKGQMYHMPCLGWKEFTPDYVGVFREGTTVCEEIDIKIPSMLKTCFPKGKNSDWVPDFYRPRNARWIRKGVLSYVE